MPLRRPETLGIHQFLYLVLIQKLHSGACLPTRLHPQIWGIWREGRGRWGSESPDDILQNAIWAGLSRDLFVRNWRQNFQPCVYSVWDYGGSVGEEVWRQLTEGWMNYAAGSSGLSRPALPLTRSRCFQLPLPSDLAVVVLPLVLDLPLPLARTCCLTKIW